MNWYLKCVSQYADFSGRARRTEFWMFVLFNVIFAVLAALLDGFLETSGIIYRLYILAMFLPGLAVLVRRLHDVGKSGWFILIPIYNLILTLTGGDQGSNEYGPDPKSEGNSASESTVLDSNY